MIRDNKLKPLVVPVINLNGNSATDLIDDLRIVLHNLTHLQASMIKASDITHGRNFQTTTAPDLIRREANEAWRQRYDMIDAFLTEVRELAIAIDEQKRK